MNIKPFGASLSLLTTALVVYLLYICRGEVSLPVMIAGGLTVLATSFMGSGIRVEPSRTAVLNTIVSWCFCAAYILINILFALLGAGIPWIIIANGVLLTIYLVVIRNIIKARQ